MLRGGGGAHRTFVSTLLALIGNLWGLPRETALRKGPAFFDGNIWNSMKTLLIACEVLDQHRGNLKIRLPHNLRQAARPSFPLPATCFHWHKWEYESVASERPGLPYDPNAHA